MALLTSFIRGDTVPLTLAFKRLLASYHAVAAAKDSASISVKQTIADTIPQQGTLRIGTARYDYASWSGSTFTLDGVLLDTAIAASTHVDVLAPEDITDWVFTLTLKRRIADLDDDAALHLHVTATGEDATAGRCTLTLDSELTGAVPEREYVMDLRRAIPGAPPDVKTLIPPQTVTVKPRVSQEVLP